MGVEGELSLCLVIQYLVALLDLPHWYLSREVGQLYDEGDLLILRTVYYITHQHLLVIGNLQVNLKRSNKI